MSEKVNDVPNGCLKSASTKLSGELNELNFIHQKLETFRTTIVNDVEKRISVVVDEVMQELRQHELQLQEFKNFANIYAPNDNRIDSSQIQHSSGITKSSTTSKPDSHKHKKKAENSAGHKKLSTKNLPDKVYISRESYLTALLKIDHMRSIYHIFHIIFLVLCSHTLAYDYFVQGKVHFGLNTFKDGFDKIHYVLGVWLLQHAFVFLLYYAFRVWSFVRTKLQKQTSLQRFWSHSCLITYIASQLVFGYVGTVLCLKFNLPFVSASVLLLETTRLLMKMHAFVRTNAAKVISNKVKCDDDEVKANPQLAPFSWYIYFLFAPTLIYRESYPRTAQIRWKFALARFMEGLTVAFLFSYLHQQHMTPHFANYGREPITAAALIVKFFGMCMPSVIIFLGGFFLILHAWLNFTSELLRFGDRLFYTDWWTAHNYADYYRKWNIVVHDWLYEYIYKDAYKHLFHGSKTAAGLMVFIISALVHEHILGFAMQLFFPVMFISFGFLGVIFVFLTKHASKNMGNLFLWFSLIIGNTIIITLYYMEYYARQNCAVQDQNGWTDLFIPMVWKCRS